MAGEKEIHGLEHLGRCYDVLDFDPFNINASGKIYNAIEAVGEGVPTREQGQYKVPVGVSATSVFSTEVKQFESKIFTSYDFQSELTKTIEANTGVAGLFEFSASTTFKEVTQTTESRERVFTYVIVFVQNHKVALNLDWAKDHPLSRDFTTAVARLPLDGGNAYVDFVRKFGTHFLSRASLGGMAIQRVSTTVEKLMSSKQVRETFETEASIEIKKFKAGTKHSDIKDGREQREKNTELKWSEIIFRGGIGETQQISSDWFQQLEERPALVARDTTLERLSRLLTPEFFHEDGDIGTKRKLLDQATTTYIVQRGGDVGGRIHYGRPVKLLTRIGNREVYFEPAHAKDVSHDAMVDRLYPHSPDSHPHAGARLAKVVLEAASEKRGPDDEILSTSNQLLNLQVEQAGGKYLKQPSGSREGALSGKLDFSSDPKSKTAQWSVRVVGASGPARPLMSGDVVLISRFNESDQKFYMISSDPLVSAVGLFHRASEKDPLMGPHRGAHFVIKNVG